MTPDTISIIMRIESGKEAARCDGKHILFANLSDLEQVI